MDSRQRREFQVAQGHEEKRVDRCGHERFRVDIRVDVKIPYFQCTIAGLSASSSSGVAGEGGLNVSSASTAARFAVSRI